MASIVDDGRFMLKEMIVSGSKVTVLKDDTVMPQRPWERKVDVTTATECGTRRMSSRIYFERLLEAIFRLPGLKWSSLFSVSASRAVVVGLASDGIFLIGTEPSHCVSYQHSLAKKSVVRSYLALTPHYKGYGMW